MGAQVSVYSPTPRTHHIFNTMAAMKTMKKASAAKKKSAMKTMKKAAKKSSAKKSSVMKKKGKKAKRVSKTARGRGAKAKVFKGKHEKTAGGLRKENLCLNKYGKVVSKKSSDRAKKSKFMQAVSKARKELKIKGFQAVGGKTAAGQALLN